MKIRTNSKAIQHLVKEEEIYWEDYKYYLEKDRDPDIITRKRTQWHVLHQLILDMTGKTACDIRGNYTS